MQNGREKKPPVNIKELKNQQGQEEHKPGELTYIEGNKKGPTTSSGKAKLNYTQLAIAVGLSVLIAVIIGNFFYTSKDDALTLLDNQVLLEENQQDIRRDLNSETGRVENIIANYATKSELSSVESQIQGFATQSALDSLKNLVTGHESDITSLESTTDDHEDRITELEASVNGTTVINNGGGSFDYYLDGNSLNVKVSRGGIYRFKFTLIDKGLSIDEGFIHADVLEYYTGSHELEGGEWSGGNLNKVKYALGDLSLDDNLNSYDIYVEILVGNAEEVEENGGSW